MPSSTLEQMEFPPLEVMLFRDHILTFKQLESERIHEAWARSLGPGNRVLVDQLIPGGITRQPYVIAAHLLDNMVETNQEVKENFMMAALMTQMDELAKKVRELDIQCIKKDRYVPPHERRKSKNKGNGQTEAMLTLILQKANTQDRVLEELWDNVLLLTQMSTSNAMLIQLLGSQMDQDEVWEVIGKMEISDQNGPSRRIAKEVGNPDSDLRWTKDNFEGESVKLARPTKLLASHRPGR
uniref:Integrase core domain containing protein n=1 Tax=Solanum tuberosum TaxID=4113 RepID=M1DAI4_SOLTU